MNIVREYRNGGPADGRTERISAGEAEMKYAAYRVNDGTKSWAIYRRAESATTGDWLYHFYDFIEFVTDEKLANRLHELEHGPASGESRDV